MSIKKRLVRRLLSAISVKDVKTAIKRRFRISNKDDSSVIEDKEIIQSFISKPDFPWLISFPRTGSHWLRMIMELYFEKPSLVRIFYFKDAKDFTCYHRHDEDLSISGCCNVVYLYRNPIETIYSQLNYYRENIDDRVRIAYWAELYGKHLSKWLLEENFVKKKTLIRYEGIKDDMSTEFKKICNHFGCKFDKIKLDEISQKVSKEELKKKTSHDKHVVVLSQSYQNKKTAFRKKHGGFVMECVYAQNDKLKRYFNESQ